MDQNNNYSYTNYQPAPADPDVYTGDPKFKPLGAWALAGYSLLFSIPFGFIFAIVFSFNNDNINRRNFARSYWCLALIGLGLGILSAILIFVLVAALGSNFLYDVERMFRYM